MSDAEIFVIVHKRVGSIVALCKQLLDCRIVSIIEIFVYHFSVLPSLRILDETLDRQIEHKAVILRVLQDIQSRSQG